MTTDKVEMIEVSSANIKSIGYDKASKELHVTFKATSSLYRYQQVPLFVWKKMLASESKNQFLREIIQPYFKYVKENDNGTKR